MLSADPKSAVFLRVPSLTKVEVRSFPKLGKSHILLSNKKTEKVKINDVVLTSSVEKKSLGITLDSSTLLLLFFRSYSPNVLLEILKSKLLLILKVLKKRPVDILKTSRKGVRRVTSLKLPQEANSKPLVQMHFSCIIFNSISPNVCLKY